MSSWLAGSAKDFLAKSREAVNQAATSAQQLAHQAELDRFAVGVSETLLTSAQNLAEHGEAAIRASADKVASGATALGISLSDDAHDGGAFVGGGKGPSGEMAQLFWNEARALSTSLSRRAGALAGPEVRETFLRWEARLDSSASADTAGGTGAQLAALLQSRALQLTLEALAGAPALRSLLRSAAGAEDSAGSKKGTKGTGVLLLKLLVRASAAAPSLLTKLLSLLADAIEELEAATARGDNYVANQDVRWVLALISHVLTDGREANLLAGSTLQQAVERALSVAPPSDVSDSAHTAHVAQVPFVPRNADPKVEAEALSAIAAALDGGGAVWACWPGDGRYYRAKIKSHSHGRVEVGWLRKPVNVPVVSAGESPEYLNSAGGDDTAFMVLSPSAIRAISEDRPQPVTAQGITSGDGGGSNADGGLRDKIPSEEFWSQQVLDVQKVSREIVVLRELRTSIEASVSKKGAAGDATISVEAPPLAKACESLAALRVESERQVEALKAQTAQCVDSEKSSQDQMQVSTGGFEAELDTMRSQLEDADKDIAKLASERDEIQERLRVANERLAIAATARGEIANAEGRVRGNMTRVSQELKRQLATGEQQEQSLAARRRLLEATGAASQSVEELLACRAKALVTVIDEREKIRHAGPELAVACFASERARARKLEELLSGWHTLVWGPCAEQLAHDQARLVPLRTAHLKVGTFVEQAWKACVQLAAEELDSGRSEDMSRSASRYKEMRQQLASNLDRLAKLEAAPVVREAPPSSGHGYPGGASSSQPAVAPGRATAQATDSAPAPAATSMSAAESPAQRPSPAMASSAAAAPHNDMVAPAKLQPSCSDEDAE